MLKVLIFILSLLFVCDSVDAQQKWDLKTCVEYAIEHNKGVQLAEVQAKIAAVSYKQSQLSILPGLNFSTNGFFNTGNNQDPTTFSRVTENYLSAGMQLQSSTEIFNFYSKRNRIEASKWETMATVADFSKIKYDIGLSTANAYLQTLLAKDQIKIASVQISQTQSQLNVTRKIIEAGALPELNAIQLEAQLAFDSSNYITAEGNFNQAKLALKSLLGLDAAEAFDIETPPIETIPIESIADLQADFVYQEALKNQPQQIGNSYRIKAAEKTMLVAKASQYPTLSAFGSISSNYLAFKKRPIYEKEIAGYQSTGLIANAGGGVFYDVQSPILTNGNIASYFKSGSLNTQFKDNLRKSIGLTINVPLFNGGTAKANFERSKLNIQSAKLQEEQDNLKLKQDIYQAYNAAITALQKFNASKKSVESSTKTYEFAGKRFNIGMLNMFDLIAAQNNLLRAQLEFSINQFDYVFKMKVLEFYKGAGLKL